MPSKIQRELALLVTGKDVSATRTLRGVNRELNKVGRISAKAGTNMSRNLQHGALIAGAAVTAAGAYTINAAMDFESSSASVRKTVDGNVDSILRANRELAKTTGLEVNALNEISATAGALGIAKADVDDFTKTVALLGVTTDDVSTDVGASALGHLGTTLKLKGSDFEHFGNDLVYLGNHGASTEGQILSMAENIAGAAATMDASKPAVLGWASALANTGEEAEAGGSSIQRFWLESFKAVHEGGAELKLMSKIAGQTPASFKKAFGKDATGTLAKFLVKLGKLSKAEQLATLSALGFKDIRITRALLKLLANTDNLTDSLDASQKGWDENKAAQQEAAKRFETTAAKLDILKANVNDAAITIGSKLLPVLAELSTDAVKWIDDHQGDIEKFGQDLATGARDALAWLKEVDWDKVGSALGVGADAAKTLVGAFLDAPPWLQEFLIGGFLANKFSGGAVMDIAGALLGGVIKGVLGMTAAVVNLNAGVVNGPGVGGPGGGGGGTPSGPGGVITPMVGAAAVIDGRGLANNLANTWQKLADVARAEGRLADAQIFQGRADALRDRGLAGMFGPGGGKAVARNLATIKPAIDASKITNEHQLDRVIAAQYSADTRSEAAASRNAAKVASATTMGAASVRESIRAKSLSVVLHSTTSVRVNASIARRTIVSESIKQAIRSGQDYNSLTGIHG